MVKIEEKIITYNPESVTEVGSDVGSDEGILEKWTQEQKMSDLDKANMSLVSIM